MTFEYTTKFIFMLLSKAEIRVCLNFFNQGGWVLDFSTEQLDNFTSEVVGIPICETYGLSKGKSLEAYVKNAPEYNSIKLFASLMEHYELSIDFDLDKTTNSSRYSHYQKCKTIIDKSLAGGGILVSQNKSKGSLIVIISAHK